MKNKNVLVTGGAGFIGSNLVYKLLEFGANVIVVDNLITGKLENLNTNNLNGSLPSQIAALTGLYELILHNNSLGYYISNPLLTYM